MPTVFSFDESELEFTTFIGGADLTTGSGHGIDLTTRFSALAPDQSIGGSFDVDVFAITMIAGVTYRFDVDGGRGDSQFIDMELDIIAGDGRLVRSEDDGFREDLGSSDFFELDPFINFTPDTTGVYYIALHHFQNNYLNGEWDWTSANNTTGDYSINVSRSSMPARQTLTDADNVRTYSDSDQLVLALGGRDQLRLNDGDDIAQGGRGSDRIYGGEGDDELGGDAGADVLSGGDGADVLRGMSDSDTVNGGLGADHLYGGGRNDDLRGDKGNDLIAGGNGNDAVFGGAGADFLRGGRGIDTLFGADGEDVFHFRPGEAEAAFGTNVDRIDGFEEGDIIDLSDMNLGSLTFRGSGAFTGINQVRIEDFGGDLFKVQVNLDFDLGDREADIVVDATSTGGLSFADFDLS